MKLFFYMLMINYVFVKAVKTIPRKSWWLPIRWKTYIHRREEVNATKPMNKTNMFDRCLKKIYFFSDPWHELANQLNFFLPIVCVLVAKWAGNPWDTDIKFLWKGYWHVGFFSRKNVYSSAQNAESVLLRTECTFGCMHQRLHWIASKTIWELRIFFRDFRQAANSP